MFHQQGHAAVGQLQCLTAHLPRQLTFEHHQPASPRPGTLAHALDQALNAFILQDRNPVYDHLLRSELLGAPPCPVPPSPDKSRSRQETARVPCRCAPMQCGAGCSSAVTEGSVVISHMEGRPAHWPGHRSCCRGTGRQVMVQGHDQALSAHGAGEWSGIQWPWFRGMVRCLR